MTPLGSSAALIRRIASSAAPCWRCMYGELEADPVVVVDHRAGVERGGHPVLPDAVVQRERIRPAVRHHEAAVDHRPPRVPVREVHAQLEAGVAVRLAHGGPAPRTRPRSARRWRPRRACPRSPAARADGAGGRSRTAGPTSAGRAPGRAPRPRPRAPARSCAAPRARPPPPRPRRPARCTRRKVLAHHRREASRVASSSYIRTTEGRWPTCSARGSRRCRRSPTGTRPSRSAASPASARSRAWRA